MCQVCRQYPCHPRCPNAEPPRPVYTCDIRNEGIYDGERYFDSPRNGPICENCIGDMGAKEFMELVGESFDTAERSSPIWRDG